MQCKSKQSQSQRLFQLLKRGWVSPLQALREVGTMKLATRVSELRAMNVKVRDKWSEDRSHKLYTIRGGR